MRRRILLFSLVTVLAVLALAGVAQASTVRGKVVHRNVSARSFVVADRTGHLTAVHARRSPALGRRVAVQGRTLANGTFGATSITRGLLTHRARVRGTVTYVNHRRTSFVVSAHGVSLVVDKHALRRVPAVGTDVVVTGTFDDDSDIDADSADCQGDDYDAAELEGHVLAIDTEARTLTLSADDNDELAGSIVIHIPDGWDMIDYAVGDELEIAATLNDDGSYTAVRTSDDGDEQEADEQGDEQGDCTDLEGQIVAVDMTARTVTMTTEDCQGDDNDDQGDDDQGDVSRQCDGDDDGGGGDTGGTEVVVHIPDGWDMSVYTVGAWIELAATPNADGSYTAVTTSEDDD